MQNDFIFMARCYSEIIKLGRATTVTPQTISAMYDKKCDASKFLPS